MRIDFRHIIVLITAIAAAACANVDGPANLEPELTIGAASDITRTSATVSVKVINHGTTELSYIRFHYGIDGETGTSTPDLDLVSGEASYTLPDLTPGCTYFYYAEGGTATATLKSDIRRFTTIPNTLPVVSAPQVLSSGPTGIIVEYEILEDGGEAITATGCEIALSPNDLRRMLVPDACVGKHTVVISGLDVNTSYRFHAFASNSLGEAVSESVEYTTSEGIVLKSAGDLASLFADMPFACASIAVSGDMNGSDFKFLHLCEVENLNLADAVILHGGEAYDGSRFTEADIVTTGLFADYRHLKSIILPNSAIAVRRDAFSGSTELEAIYIPIAVTELTPSADCPALKEIKVSPANQYFSADDGVLFNKTATEIVWFPIGKTGHFTLPETISVIGQNAFAGTHITSLEIPSSVTKIRRGAFAGSALEKITMPDKLTNIAEGTFQNCSSLKTVILGSATEYIGSYAFDGTAMTALYVQATLPPYILSDTFANSDLPLFENCTLYVPKGCRALYRNHSKWMQFNNITEYESIP